MQATEIHIALIDTVEGCRDHQHLQDVIWGHDPPDAVPAHLLIASARHGSVVLGAYAGEQMVGLAYSIPALKEGRSVYLSHIMGVHPDWRGHGIGERLKWRQRELILERGVDTMVWTYDPLLAVNARLNIARLGATAHDYTRNYYGAMGDGLNTGLPSDRFTVEWALTAPAVQARAAGTWQPTQRPPAPIVLEAAAGGNGPVPYREATASSVLVEIPAAIATLKQRDPEAALAWRLAVRAACEALFARGYRVVDLLHQAGHIFYYVAQPEALDDEIGL